MPNWWPTTPPEVVVAPERGDLGPTMVHAPRFVDRELVTPDDRGRRWWPEVADVLAIVGDLVPLSVYETTLDDVTRIDGPSVHCYFFGWGEVLVETVRADGAREFAFESIVDTADRLIGAMTGPVGAAPGRALACTLADRRHGVVLAGPDGLVVGDLPSEPGPVRHPMGLAAEDVRILLLARLRVPAVA